MNRFFILLGSILLLSTGCQQKELIQEAPVKEHPGEVRFITSDIELFWQMVDAETPLFTASEVEQQYFHAGTPALSLFYQKNMQSPEALTKLLNSWLDNQYYEDVRKNTLNIPAQKDLVIQAFETFHALYPDAVFTDIVFVIGALNTGGVVLPNGQIVIAAEMFSKSKDTDTEYLSSWHQSVLQTPKALSAIIIHELVHLQQRRYALANNLPVGGRTLLDRALIEGGADFITHLVLGRFLNDELMAYGDPIEKELWNQFKQKMNRRNYSEWLYNGRSATDKPADLGYYVGFKIAEHYYNHTPNKKQAIKDIIQMKSGKKFLKRSGYPNSFQ